MGTDRPDLDQEEQENPAEPGEGRGGRPQVPVERAVQPPRETR